jgi:hypothetical protein
MYCFVPYQLTGIQNGIQLSHSIQEYANAYIEHLQSNKTTTVEWEKAYLEWCFNGKTIIGLNGGSTNKRKEGDFFVGSLNNYLSDVESHGINVKSFYEVDLGDQLTSFCFLVDERVWDKNTYPNFDTKLYPKHMTPEQKTKKELDYSNWVTSVGGKVNVWLRQFLPKFKTA